MKIGRRRLPAKTMTCFLLSLGLSPTSADPSEWECGGAGKKSAEMAEQASADRQAMAEQYRLQEQYVESAIGQWRDGPERKELQEASRQLQRNTEQLHSSLRRTAEAAETLSTLIRQSEVLEKIAQMEAAMNEAGARLGARWERERAGREREREQREREAGERAREQRR
jgi:hypothetical protein